jgi:cell division septum initiation protein DivIVA
MAAHRLRTIVVLAASASLAIAAAPGVAQGASTPAGTGSSQGATSLLQLALGTDALGLRVVGEDSKTSNDSGAGGPIARESVSPLQVSSTLVPALSALSLPSVETSSSSGEDGDATDPVDLGALVAGAPVPGLLSGTIDSIALRSLVDASGATSTAQGAVHDLAVLGGLFRLANASADLGSTALVTDAGAVRGLQLDGLEVVNLGALLDMLGLSLSDLPLDTAIGLLDQLGLPIPGGVSADALLATVNGLLSDTSAVRGQVSTLQGQIDDLQAQIDPLDAQLATATASVSTLTSQLSAAQAALAGCGGLPLVCDPLQAQVDTLTAQLGTAQASVTSLNSQIDALQAQIDALLDQIDALLATIQAAVDQLTGLVNGILDGLGAAPLLSVSDLVVGVTAKADDTLASSVASVVGSVGDVKLGTVSLGGLDAGALLSQATALSDQVTSTLGAILATIDPALAGVVDIDLLDKTTSVTESGGVTNAVAGITGLRATVTPPDVCAVLDRLTQQDTVGSVLTGLGGQLPAIPGPVGTVLGDLGSTVSCSAATGNLEAAALPAGVLGAITQPVRVEALSISGTGSFSVAGSSSTPSGPTLPATGGDARLAVLALALGVAGYSTRRLLVRSA